MNWFQSEPEISLELVRGAGKGTSGRIIDVGGGASRLVDVLLDSGYSNISVLDVSRTALSIAKERLGDRAQVVEWLCGDVRSFTPPHTKTHHTPSGVDQQFVYGRFRRIDADR
jgi:ubiquinone/menaquinone biosynthesis C-methylase UbiE